MGHKIMRILLSITLIALIVIVPVYAKSKIALSMISNNEVRCIVYSKINISEKLNELGKVELYDKFADSYIYQVLISSERIPELEKIPEVTLVTSPLKPHPFVISEGVNVIGVNKLHELGIRGKDVKIAVIDEGFKGYQQLLGKELPSNVIVKSFRQDRDIEAGTSHGTACAEIIYDIAPEAQLYLVNYETELELKKAVDWLIEQGVDIISFSLGYVIAPLDGSGYIDEIVENSSKKILWVVAAGNFAEKHYEGNFNDPDGDSYHNFSPDDECISFDAVAGNTIWGALSWDDWPYSSQDYDLELYYESKNGYILIANSDNPQNGTQPPYEYIEITAPYTGTYCFAIKKYSANRSVHLELFSSHKFKEFRVEYSSIAAPADAKDSLAVGAVGWDTDCLYRYSSLGPTNDGRVKPDVVAPSGVSTRTYPIFSGTSASTPYVAGVAALLKSIDNSLTPADIKKILEASAIDLGVDGKDNYYGSGRIDAFRAYQLLKDKLNKRKIFERWKKIFNNSLIYSVISSSSGYVVLGAKNLSDNYDIWISKISDTGKIIWSKTFGEKYDDFGYSIQKVNDGYIILGTLGTANGNITTLFKLDANGTLMWEKRKLLSGIGYSLGKCKSGFIVVGGDSRGWIAKINKNGDLEWIRNFTSRHLIYAVQAINNDSYIVAGSLYNRNWDVWIAKIDANGNLLYSRTLDLGGDDFADSLLVISDFIIVVGRTVKEDSNAFVLKLDKDFEVIWYWEMDGLHDEMAKAVQITPNGFIAVGGTESFGANDSDIWIREFDLEGNTLWERIIDLHGYDIAYGIIVIDSEYLIAGISESNKSCNAILLQLSKNIKPIADFSFYPQNPIVGQNITFNASSSYDPDGVIISYEWDFGDNSSGKGVVVNHTYIKPGKYTVTLTVIDNDGSSNSTSKTIIVYSQTRDLDSDGWSDDIEHTINKYNSLFNPADVPTKDDILKAIISAVNCYFHTKDEKKRHIILNDIIQMIIEYFKHF